MESATESIRAQRLVISGDVDSTGPLLPAMDAIGMSGVLPTLRDQLSTYLVDTDLVNVVSHAPEYTNEFAMHLRRDTAHTERLPIETGSIDSEGNNILPEDVRSADDELHRHNWRTLLDLGRYAIIHNE